MELTFTKIVLLQFGVLILRLLDYVRVFLLALTQIQV